MVDQRLGLPSLPSRSLAAQRLKVLRNLRPAYGVRDENDGVPKGVGPPKFVKAEREVHVFAHRSEAVSADANDQIFSK